jgi:hypothetical protein
MFDNTQEKIKKWLEKTIKNSKSAVDHGWTVERAPNDESLMIIDTDQMPFKIIVKVEEELTYVALVTGIKTGNAKPEEIEPVFRALLRKNKEMGLSKFFLMDDEDTLCLRTDLYSDYMNKDEFNLALESVILGGRWLIAQLGETEDDNRRAKEMASLGAAELLKGTPKEDVIAKMMEAGYSEDQAKQLVGDLLVELGFEKEKVVDEKANASEDKDNPVDRYIW